MRALMSDLVERVARVMYELPVRGSAITCDWAHAPDEIKEAYFDEARAAIAIALEGAAKVVTEHYQELSTEHRLLLLNRAAAIRAIITD
jgi:hypothetical protein